MTHTPHGERPQTIPQIVMEDVKWARGAYDLGLYSGPEAAVVFSALAKTLGEVMTESPEALQGAVDAARTMGRKGGGRKKSVGNPNE